MDIVNPLDTAGYDMATMTELLQLEPNTYGKIRQAGIFDNQGVTQRAVMFDMISSTLSLLPHKPVGSPATYAEHDKGKSKVLVVGHIPHNDVVTADDLVSQRQWGKVDAETLESVLNVRLKRMRTNHAITDEFLKMGAVKGIVLDSDGSTVLHNLFTEFGITQKIEAFDMTDDTANLRKNCRAVTAHIEDNLLGDVMTGVTCYCSTGWFDGFIDHSSVTETFFNYSKALEYQGNGRDPRDGFLFQGINFIEYRGSAPSSATGAAVPFIAENEAHFIPTGTTDTFKTYYAPANYFDTLGSVGRELYAKQIMNPEGNRIDILSESNPLNICRRPGVLVKGIIAP